MKTRSQPGPLSVQYVRDEQWLDGHIAELMEKYPEKCVAIVNEQVVAVGDDMGTVIDKASALHPDAEPVFWFVEMRGDVVSALEWDE